jgi:Ca2+-binding RTX toxin-like protein
LNLIDSSNGGMVSLQNEATSNVTLSGSSTNVFAGSGALNISVTGTNDTVSGGTGAETVQAAASALVYAPSAPGSLTFIGGSGGIPTVVGSTNGTENIVAGASGVVFGAGLNDSATIVAGIGQTTIFGQSGTNVLMTGSASGGGQFHAYAGNETLSGAGSSAANSFFGSSVAGSTTRMIGGSGANTFFVGATAETITGGGNNDTFAFFAQSTSLVGGAHVTITDFNPTDSIFLVGYSSTQSAHALLVQATGPAVQGTGAGLTLALSDNSTITFTNLTSQAPLFGKIGYF